jgi:hypothetical protein
MPRFLFGLSMLALAACATDPPVLECPECEPPSEPLRSIAGSTWLVRDVSFPRAMDHAAPGFDLDGIDSTDRSLPHDTCEQIARDYAPTLDAPITGVDNIGQGLIQYGEDLGESTFDGELDEAIAMGRLRWAIRVGDLVEDPEAGVLIELLLIDPAETIALDADGKPAAGQTLHAHVVAGADARVSGSVAWGEASTIATLESSLFLLPFEDFRLGGIGVDAIASTRLRAQIGGSFSVDALAQTLVDVSPMLTDDDVEASRTVFREVADLDPRADSPTTCQRVSVGLELDAIPAELVIDP